MRKERIEYQFHDTDELPYEEIDNYFKEQAIKGIF
jgi:hypothetical protein